MIIVLITLLFFNDAYCTSEGKDIKQKIDEAMARADKVDWSSQASKCDADNEYPILCNNSATNGSVDLDDGQGRQVKNYICLPTQNCELPTEAYDCLKCIDNIESRVCRCQEPFYRQADGSCDVCPKTKKHERKKEVSESASQNRTFKSHDGLQFVTTSKPSTVASNVKISALNSQFKSNGDFHHGQLTHPDDFYSTANQPLPNQHHHDGCQVGEELQACGASCGESLVNNYPRPLNNNICPNEITCEDLSAGQTHLNVAVPRECVRACVQGHSCQCKSGYYRRQHDCVPKAQCTGSATTPPPGQCQSNTMQMTNKYCHHECSVIDCYALITGHGGPCIYPHGECQAQCTCNQGLYGPQAVQSSIDCKTKQQCYTFLCPGPNERPVNCSQSCDQRCCSGEFKCAQCIEAAAHDERTVACVCNKGYARDDHGQCVPDYMCSISTTPPTPLCNANEQMMSCISNSAVPGYNVKSYCPSEKQCSTITNPRGEQHQTSQGIFCHNACIHGQSCQCRPGYYRHGPYCVHEDYCNECEDTQPHQCALWKASGLCQSGAHQTFMMNNCFKTCFNCVVTETTPPPPMLVCRSLTEVQVPCHQRCEQYDCTHVQYCSECPPLTQQQITCICAPGHYRDHSNQCIPSFRCPIVTPPPPSTPAPPPLPTCPQPPIFQNANSDPTTQYISPGSQQTFDPFNPNIDPTVQYYNPFLHGPLTTNQQTQTVPGLPVNPIPFQFNTQQYNNQLVLPGSTGLSYTNPMCYDYNEAWHCLQWKLQGYCVTQRECMIQRCAWTCFNCQYPDICTGQNEMQAACNTESCRQQDCLGRPVCASCLVNQPNTACICANGYVRNAHGVCVVKSECQPDCRDVASSIQCLINKHNQMCSGAMKELMMQSCFKTCFECIRPPVVCPGPHEVQVSCSQAGNQQDCNRITVQAVCIQPKVVGQVPSACICAEGHKRDLNGQCVPDNTCHVNKCENVRSDAQCEDWRDAGYCINGQPQFMNTNCYKTCSGCVPPKPCSGSTEVSVPCNQQCFQRHCTDTGIHQIACTGCDHSGYTCVCAPGFVRARDGLICFHETSCQPPVTDAPVFCNYLTEQSVSCANACIEQSCDGTQSCAACMSVSTACVCRPGFVRSPSLACVPRNQCPQTCTDEPSMNLCEQHKQNGLCQTPQVRKDCPSTCNVCQSAGAKICSNSGRISDCECNQRKRAGHCEASGWRAYMTDNCAQTCGFCDCRCQDVSSVNPCALLSSCLHPFMRTQCKKSCGLCASLI